MTLREFFPKLFDLELVNVAVSQNFFNLVTHFRYLTNLVVYAAAGFVTNYSVSDVTKLCRHSQYLERLIITLPLDRGVRMEKLLDLIMDNPALEALSVRTRDMGLEANNATNDRFVLEHQALVELHLDNYRFTTDVASDLVNGLKNLNQFTYAHTPIDANITSARIMELLRNAIHRNIYGHVDANWIVHLQILNKKEGDEDDEDDED